MEHPHYSPGLTTVDPPPIPKANDLFGPKTFWIEERGESNMLILQK